MGGSSHSYIQEADVARLRDIARRELAAAEGRAHVFLSFAAENLDEINLLRGQAAADQTELSFDDWSVRVPFDSEDAGYIRSQIRERIRRSSATLVLLTPESASSQWVRWEIEESLRQGKKVAGIYSGDQPPAQLPQPFRSGQIPIMPWRHDQIIAFLGQ